MKHESPVALKDEWLTPPWILKNLGEFDLDPCAPVIRPWPTAKAHLSINDNGLLSDWYGRVWLNPPYGKNINAWMNKMALHDDGIALVFARTETEWFHQFIWSVANGLLFIKKRIKFHNIDGSLSSNAGAPSVLISYGNNNEALNQCHIPGKFVDLIDRFYIIVVDYSNHTWKVIVEKALNKLQNPDMLDNIYDTVINMAPKKVQNNKHFKAKIRQTLQMHFKNFDKGVWGNN